VVANLKPGRTRASLFDYAGTFMPPADGVAGHGKVSGGGMIVRMAQAAGDHSDRNLALSRLIYDKVRDLILAGVFTNDCSSCLHFSCLLKMASLPRCALCHTVARIPC
jgi:hypothetical protein